MMREIYNRVMTTNKFVKLCTTLLLFRNECLLLTVRSFLQYHEKVYDSDEYRKQEGRKDGRKEASMGMKERKVTMKSRKGKLSRK